MNLPLSVLFIVNRNMPSSGVVTHLLIVADIGLILALLSALLFAFNLVLFRRPGRPWNKRLLPPVSVLIPARNEELSIAEAIQSVLKSRGVDFELIVLDDGSTDRTVEIVKAYAEASPRVRLEISPPLPEGWNGKQHACWVLASLATHNVFCYLDADVRVGPEAIYRMVSELNYIKKKEPEKALVSGFPRQLTKTFLEQLLLPLIHFVLLGYLPLAGERWTRWPAFATGCGQFMMVRREPYFATGGHSANPLTMHDGLLLPKLFRREGFRTSVYDLSRDAVCRMYASAGEVWRGLTKNATEGMGSPARIPIFTVLLISGQVAALPLGVLALIRNQPVTVTACVLTLIFSYGTRFACTWRFNQNWRGAMWHPLGVLVLVVLQWYALLRKLFRRPTVWKERKYQVG